MYRHYVVGMFKGLDGRLYKILAPAPSYHFKKKDAQKDTFCNKSFDEMFSQLKPSQPIFIKEVGNVIKTFGILDMKMDDKSLKADCLNV